MQNRETLLNDWLKKNLDSPYTLIPLTGDASFRRYYRLQHDKLTRIIMDAPPEREALEPFILVSQLLQKQGLITPLLHAFDVQQGFALLDDFGDTLLLSVLNQENADLFYHLAIDKLMLMQKCPLTNYHHLPVFDKPFILKELAIFQEWFLQKYLKLTLTEAEQELLATSLEWLAQQVSQQPQTLIHRDYHSRNLMVLNQSPTDLGIIDFQDAMQGPLTYDLVSLLKDCYIQWPKAHVSCWLNYYYDNTFLAKQHYSLTEFTKAFDLCGLQRHLKVLGVFARLHLRDNKSGYLNDLPLTLHYVSATLESCSELQAFYQFIQKKVVLP